MRMHHQAVNIELICQTSFNDYLAIKRHKLQNKIYRKCHRMPPLAASRDTKLIIF